MRSFNLRLKQSVKHIATVAVVLAALIHATAEPAKAGARVGRQPNSTGFSFELNDNAELKDGVFKGAVQNPFFLTSSSSGNNCPPSVGFVANCISFNPGDLTPSISSESSILDFYNTFLGGINGLEPGSEGFISKDIFQSTYTGGTSYKTILYPIDPNEASPFSLEIFLPRSGQDFTQRIPSYLDFQQAFSVNDIWILYPVTVANEESPNGVPTPQATKLSVNDITNVSSEVEPVPEPIEGTVLGAGVMGAGLLLLKRRKAKQKSSKL